MRPADGQLPFTISMGTPREPAHMVCGFLGATPGRSIRCWLRCRRSSASAIARRRVARSSPFALAESKEPRIGGECVLGRLSELMFVDVVRRYLEPLPADRTDWLAGLRDPFFGRALTALHRNPARDWTLESLAHEVGLSRSVLAERFTQFVGQPAMQDLTNWRMQLAANHLLSGLDSVAASPSGSATSPRRHSAAPSRRPSARLRANGGSTVLARRSPQGTPTVVLSDVERSGGSLFRIPH